MAKAGKVAAAAAADGAATLWRARTAQGSGVEPSEAFSEGTYAAPELPHWVRARMAGIPALPEGWADPGARLLREWALRPGWGARVAIINALYAGGAPVQRLLPVLIAESLRRDRFAMALTGPPAELWVTPTPSPPPGALRAVWGGFVQSVADLWRAVSLLLLFAPAALTAFPALQYGLGRSAWMLLLRHTLEAAGPAFIKWGQWAATRHDLFPPDMCTELEHLHTQAPAHSLGYTEAAVKRAFGASTDELFEDFPDAPVASGSIGQVYKAKLSAKGARNTGIDPGTVVAVKVRHPGVGQAIQRDFALMLRVARLLSLLPATAHLRLEDSLSQFAAPLREQVDLAREARHLWQFNYNFRHSRYVTFPYPVYPLVSDEVLVETFEEGEGISRYVEAGPKSAFNSRLAQLGSQTMLQMMLVDNLIHSDLHPGNILVALDPPPPPLLAPAAALLQRLAPYGLTVPEAWLQPRIVLLDVGMATHLSPEEQSIMLELFQALARLDGREIGRQTLRFSGSQQTCPDPQAFLSSLQTHFQRLQKGSWDDAQFANGAEAMSAVLELVRRHQVSMPGHICAVVVTTLVLEGWSSKLDPTHSVMDQVSAIVAPGTAGWAQRLSMAIDAVMLDQTSTRMLNC
ncbi:hypothetical protein WJX81_000321 [Elliptochloris bilobata]|uniref:ABC1 atypical kinase-like domain-containing protein n=1 Tax=Elliptochloris bilobata TaxID=381761 RepID=A0AAW1RST7_9CHLO